MLTTTTQGKTMKIEPMSVEEIKAIRWQTNPTIWRKIDPERLVLAWAHERALNTLNERGKGQPKIVARAVNEVLDEIGWPKDQR